MDFPNRLIRWRLAKTQSGSQLSLSWYRSTAGGECFKKFARLSARVLNGKGEGLAQKAIAIEPAKVAQFPRSIGDVPRAFHYG